MNKASTSLIWRIMKAQRYKCTICASSLNAFSNKPRGRRTGLSVDHVIPKALGGGNSGNRLIVHAGCNHRKANRKPTGCELVWLHAVNARIGLSA